ncbi:hypothetical protein RJT34_04579 [Clitoria ternatea]|uniref:Uncharacterized protein n=1 Tax=Clitoria ternatea TaxID=43366 RepID=A0AAN9Q2D5_CLITE
MAILGAGFREWAKVKVSGGSKVVWENGVHWGERKRSFQGNKQGIKHVGLLSVVVGLIWIWPFVLNITKVQQFVTVNSILKLAHSDFTLKKHLTPNELSFISHPFN